VRGRVARLTLAAGCLAVGVALASSAAASHRPHVSGLRCLDRCAGVRAVAVGGKVSFSGRHLGHIAEVRFPGSGGPVTVAPASTDQHRVKAVVPAGADDGRPLLAEAGGDGDRAPKALRVVPDSSLPGSFSLDHAKAGPRHVFFDGRHPERLRFRFASAGRADVRILAVHRHTGHVAKSWTERNLLPYSQHSVRWDGSEKGGDAAPDGKYKFKLGERGNSRRFGAGRFHLFGYEFPVRGSHGYGGALQRFGAPRSGGRVHQGQDIFSPCGTKEVAARGGTVQARGSDPVLYGNWLVIDGRGTGTDHRYAHLLHPTPLHTGERVRTGQTIGRVGKTGNAESVGCMLHFEMWPHGWGNGSPVDPLPSLRRWDGWS
jgi:murein DD-endopeptidase MepM/ murein hydrolase activator NlpD